MPEAFEACIKAGGRVRRKSLEGGKYQNICYDGEGTAHPGEVKEKKHKFNK